MNATQLLPSQIQWLKRVARDPNLSNFQLVQSLWSDFGKLLRCYSPIRRSTIIVKLIEIPEHFSHPRGWNNQVSQQRKWRSYEVEHHFYENFASCLKDDIPYAEFLGGETHNQSRCIVLGDLDQCGYPLRYSQLRVEQCHAILRWLAHFHAQFMQISPTGLWQRGSYWHLSTRQDEFHTMEPGELKSNAIAIDNALASCPYQTLIHGDAKVANFCFSERADNVAAVDFQYVGGGIGVQDVAYFIGSALTEKEQIKHENSCLNLYFSILSKQLSKNYSAEVCADICTTWQQMYTVANADFYRFLLGWSPKHYKINPVLQCHSANAIAWLNSVNH